MNTTTDNNLVAVDQFVSWIYWADDDLTLSDALPDALDDWTATAAAEHNGSEPFTASVVDTDALATALHELLAAVRQLRDTARPELTVTRAICEALADQAAARRPQGRLRG